MQIYGPHISVIFQGKSFIVNEKGLWLLAYKILNPENDSIKIISRKIYYNQDIQKIIDSLYLYDIFQELRNIIRLINDLDQDFLYKVTLPNNVSPEILEIVFGLLELRFELEGRVYTLFNSLNLPIKSRSLLNKIIQKDSLNKLQELKIIDYRYFKLTELQKKKAFAFRYSSEDKIVIYLIYTTTVFEDLILFVAYQNNLIVEDTEKIKEAFDPQVKIQKLTLTLPYENLFLNEVFGPDVFTYYPREFHYSSNELKHFESKIRFISLLPDLEFLSFIKKNQERNLWYRTLLDDYLIYFCLIYGQKVHLYYVGFNRKNRNKTKNSLINEKLFLYIDELFLHKFESEHYFSNESTLLKHLKNPKLTRY